MRLWIISTLAVVAVPLVIIIVAAIYRCIEDSCAERPEPQRPPGDKAKCS